MGFLFNQLSLLPHPQLAAEVRMAELEAEISTTQDSIQAISDKAKALAQKTTSLKAGLWRTGEDFLPLALRFTIYHPNNTISTITALYYRISDLSAVATTISSAVADPAGPLKRKGSGVLFFIWYCSLWVLAVHKGTSQLGFHFGSKILWKISIVFEELSRHSALFKPKWSPNHSIQYE